MNLKTNGQAGRGGNLFKSMNITKCVVSERDRALIGGDYNNYHIQATRRIHTIRKRLGATTPKGKKYAQRSSVTAQDVAKNAQ